MKLLYTLTLLALTPALGMKKSPTTKYFSEKARILNARTFHELRTYRPSHSENVVATDWLEENFKFQYCVAKFMVLKGDPADPIIQEIKKTLWKIKKEMGAEIFFQNASLEVFKSIEIAFKWKKPNPSKYDFLILKCAIKIHRKFPNFRKYLNYTYISKFLEIYEGFV